MPLPVPVVDFGAERFFLSVTSWLDQTFATDYRSHRQLIAVDDDVEMAMQAINECYNDLQGPLTPVSVVASHAMHLRIDDLDLVLAAKWQRPAVRVSALAAMRGIHERFLGPIAKDSEDLVHYPVTRNLWNKDFAGFVESHRVERRGIYGEFASGIRGPGITVVCAPRWTWDVLHGLLDDPDVEGSLAAHYRPRHDSTWTEFGFAIGEPVRIEPDDVSAALTLWEADRPDSVYFYLRDAAIAAAML